MSAFRPPRPRCNARCRRGRTASVYGRQQAFPAAHGQVRGNIQANIQGDSADTYSESLPAALAALEARLAARQAAQHETLLLQLHALRQELEQAVFRNTTQQTQLDRLHTELQEHRNGLLQKLQQPWIMGLVQIYDALHRGAKDVAAADLPLSADDAATMLEDFRQDVEIALEQQGVTPFNVHGDRFDPTRQTAIKTVPALEPELAGVILLRLRPGFEQEGRVLRKEWVCVYSAPASITPSATFSPKTKDT